LSPAVRVVGLRSVRLPSTDGDLQLVTALVKHLDAVRELIAGKSVAEAASTLGVTPQRLEAALEPLISAGVLAREEEGLQVRSGGIRVQLVSRRALRIDWLKTYLQLLRSLPGTTRWIRLWLRYRVRIDERGGARTVSDWIFVNGSSEEREKLVREFKNGGARVRDIRAYDAEGELPLEVEEISEDLIRVVVHARQPVPPGGLFRHTLEYYWPEDAKRIDEKTWLYLLGLSTSDIWGVVEADVLLPPGARIVAAESIRRHLFEDFEVPEGLVVKVHRDPKEPRVVVLGERLQPGWKYLVRIQYSL